LALVVIGPKKALTHPIYDVAHKKNDIQTFPIFFKAN